VGQLLQPRERLVQVPDRSAHVPGVALPGPLRDQCILLAFAAVDDIGDHGKVEAGAVAQRIHPGVVARPVGDRLAAVPGGERAIIHRKGLRDLQHQAHHPRLTIGDERVAAAQGRRPRPSLA
jgi:hypothetical protein